MPGHARWRLHVRVADQPGRLGELAAVVGATGRDTDGGSAVGLGTLRPTGQVALLVEDAWQGRGVGTTLTRRLVHLARQCGHQEIVAETRADNHRLIRLLRRSGLRPQGRQVDGMLHVRADLVEPLPGPADGPAPASVPGHRAVSR